MLSENEQAPEEKQSSLKRAQMKEADKDFCHLFSLPNSESPVEGKVHRDWVSGATSVDK